MFTMRQPVRLDHWDMYTFTPVIHQNYQPGLPWPHFPVHISTNNNNNDNNNNNIDNDNDNNNNNKNNNNNNNEYTYQIFMAIGINCL